MFLIPSWHFWLKSFLFSTILVSTSVTVLIVAPAMETAYFPVVSVMSIDKVEPINDVSAKVWASYRKLRPCQFVGVSWYHYDENTEAIQQVGMTLTPKDPEDTSSPTRPTGYIVAGPWNVSMPADEIRSKSLVEVFHQCTLLWVSKTHYYP